jgi:hypothetical protein
MRALLQPELRVRLGCPSRHITKGTNRFNRLIGIDAINKLMKMHALSGIVLSHGRVPDNSGCIA